MSVGWLPYLCCHPLWFALDPGEVRGVGGDEIGTLLTLNGELSCAQFTVVNIWLPS
jgi:hypothetical protein